MPDQRHIQFIYVHHYPGRLRRNGHRDLDCNRCLRQGTSSRIKDHHRQPGSVADHDCTC